MQSNEIAKQVEEEFMQYDDWMDKYNHLIEMGKDLPLIDEQHKTKQNLISGCQSRVWLHAKYEEGRIYFSADSDAVITKGIVAMLVRVFSGQKPEDIINADTSFIENTGLKDHLSPTRSNGLVSMVKQMKLYALAFKTKEQQNQ